MTIIGIFVIIAVIFGAAIFVSAASRKTLMNASGIFAIIFLILIPITVYTEEYVRTFIFMLLLISNTFTYFNYRERSKS